MDKPILVVISSNRNYGWIASAFLAANTKWADYVVIVDQMSTDGSRDMYAKYDNVIVVDDTDLSFKENTRAKMAFERARQIPGDKIFFALDIDEILPSNWMNTPDGQRIINSQPGDMFQLYWANISPNGKQYYRSVHQYKVLHDNGIQWQECSLEIHAPHLPYITYDTPPIFVNDFPNLHFGFYNTEWRKYNNKYYSFLVVHQKRCSIISQNRSMLPSKGSGKVTYEPIKDEWFEGYGDIFSLIDTTVKPQGIALIKELIEQDGIDKYKCLDIWDEDLLAKLGLEKDPRSVGWKILHYYLRKTQPYKQKFIVKAIDKVLKSFV